MNRNQVRRRLDKLVATLPENKDYTIEITGDSENIIRDSLGKQLDSLPAGFELTSIVVNVGEWDDE